ncbi:MAG: isoprenylcysteine carboxylmethyltransferase family protein [Chloroflexi bacterium]|nr:isoprenylcysteine carboxylmethyltransferase family protein [Chloroflexota bacterium]
MWANAAAILGAMLGFGVIHSLTAGLKLKQGLTGIFGERPIQGLYRFAYNAFSVLTILPALVLVLVLPNETVYAVGLPWSVLLTALQVTGLVGLVISVLSIDLLRFVGLSQIVALVDDKPLPLPEEDLQTNGVYRLVRHPLYFFSLLLIWAVPVMTVNWLVFCLGSTAYFVFGSLIEERRMLNAFGDRYARYMKQVPWMLPWPRPKQVESKTTLDS